MSYCFRNANSDKFCNFETTRYRAKERARKKVVRVKNALVLILILSSQATKVEIYNNSINFDRFDNMLIPNQLLK